MEQNTVSNSLLNVLLVFVESALTLVLRFDPKLRQAAYPLVKNDIVVCIRTYLPHTQVFATFSSKGVLLDANLPSHHNEPDVVINAYTTQICNVLVSNNPKQVEKLPIRGATETVAQVQAFLMQLGIGSLLQSIIKNIKGKKSDKPSQESSSAHALDTYKEQVKQQQQQINTLTVKNRELETQNKELQSKQKTILVTLGIVILIAVVSTIGWLT